MLFGAVSINRIIFLSPSLNTILPPGRGGLLSCSSVPSLPLYSGMSHQNFLSSFFLCMALKALLVGALSKYTMHNWCHHPIVSPNPGWRLTVDGSKRNRSGNPCCFSLFLKIYLWFGSVVVIVCTCMFCMLLLHHSFN